MNEERIRTYFSEMKDIVDGLDEDVDNINQIIDILFEAWKKNKQVFIFGNGGSASTASHFLCDLVKGTVVEGKPRFKGYCLNDNIPLVSALTNDNGWDSIYIEQLKQALNPGDVVIAISVHGGSGADKAGVWSQNILKAVDFAKKRGAKTIGFVGFDGGALAKLADVSVVVPANSTPHTESFHVALEHMICDILKNRIMGL